MSRRGAAVGLAVGVVMGIAIGGWLATAGPRQAWELTAPDRIELQPGRPGTIEVAVVPAEGRTVSRDGPVRLDVVTPPGLAVKRRRLALGDAVDAEARAPRFAVIVSGDQAGTFPVEIAVRLWLCARQTCKPVRATRIVEVVVAAPPTPDAAPRPIDAAPRPIDGRKRRPRR